MAVDRTRPHSRARGDGAEGRRVKSALLKQRPGRFANPSAAARAAQQPSIIGPALLAGDRYSTGSLGLHLCEQDRIDFERSASARMVVDPGSTEAQPSLAEPPDTVNPIPINRASEKESRPGVDTVLAVSARRGTMSHLIPLPGSKLCADATGDCKCAFLLLT
jgi:hypothetical protein